MGEYKEYFVWNKFCEGDEIFTIEKKENGEYFFAPHIVKSLKMRDSGPETWDILELENGEKWNHGDGPFETPFFPYFFQEKEKEERIAIFEGREIAIRQATPNDIKTGVVAFEYSGQDKEIEKVEIEPLDYELNLDGYYSEIIYPYLAWKGCCIGGSRTGWELLYVSISDIPVPHYTLDEIKKMKKEADDQYNRSIAEYKNWLLQFETAEAPTSTKNPKKQFRTSTRVPKIKFSFAVRQAMQVAMAIAEEVENNTAHGREFGTRRNRETRPVLLSINDNTFRFEGGIVVKPNMIELSQFNECWRDAPEEWVVTHATIRFYELDGDYNRISDQKVEQIWDAKKLLALKDARPWWHPHVVMLDSIKGRVCIFWDNASEDGYISVDPDYNQEGYYTSINEVEYSRFVKDDLDRAKKEALDYLKS